MNDSTWVFFKKLRARSEAKEIPLDEVTAGVSTDTEDIFTVNDVGGEVALAELG